MTLKTEIQYQIDASKWNEQLSKSAYAAAFQTADYYMPEQHFRNCKTIFIIVRDSSGNIVGQLSAFVEFNDHRPTLNKISKILASKLKLGSKIVWDYGPIIFDETQSEEILKKILTILDDYAIKNRIEIIRGSTPPLSNLTQSNIFNKFGFERRKWGTSIIKLNQNPDEFFNSLSKKIRYDIRQAEEKSLTFEIGKDFLSLDDFEALKSQLKNRRNTALGQSDSLKEDVWKTWYEAGYKKLFLVRHKGQLIGAINANYFNGNLVQTSVINTRNELKGGSFLMWNAIKWAIKSKCKTYDLGGINPNPKNEKEKGIDFFKSKWKGNQYPYDILVKIICKQKKKISSLILNPHLISSKLKMQLT